MELREVLTNNGINLTTQQIQLLLAHLTLVQEANEKVQLTTIRSHEEGIRLHILDSLLCLPEIKKAPIGKLLDMGTGGGYPGIPLAVSTGRDVTLLDSVKKKCHVLDGILEEIALNGVRTAPVRAEELALELPAEYSVITARALSSLPSLVELSSPLLKNKGVLVALKGNITEEELLRGDKVAAVVGMKRLSVRCYELPEGNEKRSVVVYKKTGMSKRKLPRRPGMAQRQPLA